MKFFKKTDVWIIIALLILSAVSWFVYRSVFSGRAAKAEIYYYSKLVETIELTGGVEKSFSIPQNEHVVFHIDKQGNIKFEKSDCPDKVCINAGNLYMVGQSAACLPNGIVVKIVPLGERDDDDIDIIIGR